jgi:hypothetical protein
MATTRPTGSNGEQMEARIARLESDVSHLRSDVTDIKVDLREFRAAVDNKFKAMDEKFDGKFDSFRQELRDDFRTLWGALFFLGLGLSGLMAKGFGWL